MNWQQGIQKDTGGELVLVCTSSVYPHKETPMTLQEAINRIKSEMQFMGLNWADLEHMLQEQPEVFSYKTNMAYRIVYKNKAVA